MNSPSRSMLIEQIDTPGLVASITKAVRDELEPLLAKQATPLLVDLPEIARLTSLSPPTIERLTKAKRIPSVKVKRRRLYEPAKVVAALIASGDVD